MRLQTASLLDAVVLLGGGLVAVLDLGRRRSLRGAPPAHPVVAVADEG